jgi:hypothetical protein
MSIVTLKKKTNAQYNNMSVGSKTGFSLNGTRRSQGYVGQTSLSRSLPRTIMKGNVACGYGGLNGTFKKTPIIQSAVISLNNPSIVKPSVGNTLGLIETKYAWAKRPQPYSTTKPDTNNHLISQGDHIHNIAKQAITDASICPNNSNNTVASCKTACSYNSFYRKQIPTHTKPVSDYSFLSYGDYLIRKNNKCIKNNVIYVANKTQNIPFACTNTSTVK